MKNHRDLKLFEFIKCLSLKYFLNFQIKQFYHQGFQFIKYFLIKYFPIKMLVKKNYFNLILVLEELLEEIEISSCYFAFIQFLCKHFS
jgi:hypothetical protein